MLKQVSVPLDVLKMIPDIVRACPKCAKWTRGAKRPTLRIELVGHFNFQVEIDLFFLFDSVWLLIMDSATRYKACALIPDKTASAILRGLFRRWISIFGPMAVCVSDQEGAICSDAVATNFERLSIVRAPKGSDPEGKHTGTGGIERHVALTKLTFMKLKDGLESQCVFS